MHKLKVEATSGESPMTEMQITCRDAVETLRHDRELSHAIRKIPFPMIYFCIFVAMLYQHVPSSSLYEQSHSVASVLDSSGTDAITTDTTMKFRNMGEIADVFDWLKDTFVPSVFVTEDYNSKLLTKDKWGRIAMFNKVLGAVRFEVTRAAIHPCNAQPFLTTLYPNCYDAANVVTNITLISFDTNSTEATDLISRLKTRGDWLDYATQQLLITIVTYNGELQGYTVSKMQIDFHQGGYLELSSTTTPTISDPYLEDAAIVLDALVGVCLLITLIGPVWRLLKGVRISGIRALRQVDSVALVEIVSSVFVIAFYAVWFTMVVMMFDKKFRDNLARLVQSGKTFDANSDERLGLEAVTRSLERVARLTIVMRLLATCSVFAIGMQILTQFRFHPRLNILTRTVSNALNQFVAFFVVFIVIFITFSVSGMVLFGDRVEDFSTLPRTMESCVNMLFGNFDYSTIQDLQKPIGTLYYWAYMIVVCLILLNMMLAIVLDSYAEISEESAKISRNVSFRRTLHNISYDAQLTFSRPGRTSAQITNKQGAGPVNLDVTARKKVVFKGMIIPAVLERVLMGRQNQEEVITIGLLAEIFPGIAVTASEASATLRHLLLGSSNPHKKSKDNDSEWREKNSSRADSEREAKAATDPIAQTFVSPITPRGDEASVTNLISRMEILEQKLDLLLAKM